RSLAVTVAGGKPNPRLFSGARLLFVGQFAVSRPALPDWPCYAWLLGGASASDGICCLCGVFSPLVGISGSTQAARTRRRENRC
ncbi:hypothetical protein CWI49_00980, partial [Neisseria meningitidis]